MQKKKLWKKIMWLTSKLFPFITEPIYEVIYFIQRGIYGWSERDCWSIDYHLDEKIPEMLKWLKENKHGVPNEFVSMAVQERGGNIDGHQYGVDYTDRDVDRGSELYNAMLDKIIDGFKAHNEIEENDWDYSDLDSYRKKQAECRAVFEHGMGLFVRYYDTFWD